MLKVLTLNRELLLLLLLFIDHATNKSVACVSNIFTMLSCDLQNYVQS